MKIPFTIRAALGAYELLLTVAIPLLRFNKYIREGLAQRQLKNGPLPAAEVWIHAASVGEAYLAVEIVRHLQKMGKTSILLSATTRQGKDVLEKELGEPGNGQAASSPTTIYFPFDKPSLMKKALAMIAPRLVILLEAEIWPGLLAACKQSGTLVAMVNSRMSVSSCRAFSLWPSFWKFLRPDLILAVTEGDADRLGWVFGKNNISVVSNIKFDRMLQNKPDKKAGNPLAGIIPPSGRFVVFGSVRKEEEADITRVLTEITGRHPDLIIGVFPRHPVRVNQWSHILADQGCKWQLRSKTTTETAGGTIILWDVFGELSHAYGLATTAFIGGSLAPLGGQNFLEPLASGILPITGPDWSDFHWVGRNIIEKGLLIQVKTWQELCQTIDRQLTNPPVRDRIREQARKYILNKQGGTRQTCEKIIELLGKSGCHAEKSRGN